MWMRRRGLEGVHVWRSGGRARMEVVYVWRSCRHRAAEVWRSGGSRRLWRRSKALAVASTKLWRWQGALEGSGPGLEAAARSGDVCRLPHTRHPPAAACYSPPARRPPPPPTQHSPPARHRPPPRPPACRSGSRGGRAGHAGMEP